MAGQKRPPSATGASESRARGPYARTAARRTEIIEAAVEVFGRSGYASGSIRGIAEELGVSHATLIFHFKTKEALLAAVLERTEQSYVPALDRAAERPVEFLAYAIEVFEHRPLVPGESEMVLRLATEARDPSHPAHSYMIRRYRKVLDVFAKVFETLDERGLLKRPADASQLARFTVALMDGLQISARYQSGSAGVVTDLEGYFASVLNAEGRRSLAAQRARSHAVD